MNGTFGERGTLTQREAAAMLRVSLRTIERRVRDEQLKARRDGRRVVIDRASVEEHLANLPTPDEAPLHLETRGARAVR